MDFKNERFSLEMAALANAIVFVLFSTHSNGILHTGTFIIGMLFIAVFVVYFSLDLFDIVIIFKNISLYQNLGIDLEKIYLFEELKEFSPDIPMTYIGTTVGGISDFAQVYRNCEVPYANIGDLYYNLSNSRKYICVKEGTNLNAEWEPYDRYKQRNINKLPMDRW